MENKYISVLFFTDKEDNTKGGILGVEEANNFGTISLREKINKDVGALLDIENVDFDDFASITEVDYNNFIDNLSKRKDCEFLDYEFYWEYLEVF